MGTPKAWLSFGSEFLLCRVVRIVSEVVSPVVVVGRKGQDLPPLPSDVQTLHDRIADSGPLAGIDVGFEALTDRCSAAFVTSCDHPLLTASVVMRMVDWLGDAPGVVPSHENRLYPLTAVYALTTHDLLRQFLADRRLRAHEFAASCGARIVPASELYDIDPTLASLRNLNDPDALDGLLREAGFPPA